MRMKKIILLCLHIILLWSLPSSGKSYHIPNSKKIIIVVNSYSHEYLGTKRQQQGFEKALFEKISRNNYQILTFNLRSKKTNRKILEKNVKRVRDIVLKKKATAIFVTDDYAFKHFYPLAKANDIPLVFSGINADLWVYGYVPGEKGISGTLERYNYLAILRLFKILTQNRIQKVLIIADDDITGNFLIKDFLQNTSKSEIDDIGVEVSILKTTNFHLLTEKIKATNPKDTGLLYLVVYAQRDKNNHAIPTARIDNWINANTSHIDVGLTAAHVQAGRLMSLASNMYESGVFAGHILAGSILKKKDLSAFPIRKKLPLEFRINRNRAKKLNLKLPFKFLVYERLTSNQIKGE